MIIIIIGKNFFLDYETAHLGVTFLCKKINFVLFFKCAYLIPTQY